jgi:adenylate cyclase
VAVYGRSEGVAIYELLAMADDGRADWPAWALHYEAGLAAYRDRRWEEAERHFAAAAAERAGGDAPSQLFIGRCGALIADPPSADWTPVAIQMEK